MPRSSPDVVLPALSVDPAAARPLHVQLYERLRAAVLDGTLASGARLPSSRALAGELGLSRTTVVAAYEQLVAEGYLEGKVGAGTRVAAQLPEALTTAAPSPTPARGRPAPAARRAVSARGERLAAGRLGPELRLPGADWRVPFRIAVPALDEFPFALWTRLVQRHLRRAGQEIANYHEARGLPRLRAAIAAHLSLSRGVRCSADEVIITAGAQSAIDLAVRVLTDPGDQAVIEDPGHLGIRGALEGAGVGILPTAVDGEGLVIGGLPRAARLAVVTPSNQFPLAVVMSLTRRLALIDWAGRAGAVILEDDYDSEFRFSGRPLEALQALDRHHRVIYLGSFSKILFPGLRLGYLVVPPDLSEVFAAARRFVDVHPPVLFQAALADFMEEGHFGRHLRRMRLAYRERAQALQAAVEGELAGAVELAPARAGMHAIGWLVEGLDDRALSRAAARERVEARPLSLYALGPMRPGLVLGFGALAPKDMLKGARRLARAVDALRRGRSGWPDGPAWK